MTTTTEESAEARWDRIVREEFARLVTPKGSPGLIDKAARFVIRTLRSLAGFVIACFAWWAGFECIDRMGAPLGQMTLLGLVSVVGLGFLAFTLAAWAWGAAFGAGPPPRSPFVPLSMDQAQEAARARIRREDATSAAQVQAVANRERFGKRLAFLFDPTLATRRPWIGFVPILAFVFLCWLSTRQ